MRSYELRHNDYSIFKDYAMIKMLYHDRWMIRLQRVYGTHSAILSTKGAFAHTQTS